MILTLYDLEEQIEHLYRLYRCDDCNEKHKTQYDAILCGLDNRITDYLAEIDELEDKIDSLLPDVTED